MLLYIVRSLILYASHEISQVFELCTFHPLPKELNKFYEFIIDTNPSKPYLNSERELMPVWVGEQVISLILHWVNSIISLSESRNG